MHRDAETLNTLFACWRLGVRSLCVAENEFNREWRVVKNPAEGGHRDGEKAMRRALFFLTAIALGCAEMLAQGRPAATPADQPPTEFEVASIKRNSGADSSSSMRSEVNGRQVLTNVSARTIVSQAYPSRGSNQIVGLPAWAESEHYDVIVKADKRRPRDEQLPMWRTLLADRMKLMAHYESREEATYDLVFARGDRRLGPQLKPATCTPGATAPGTPPCTGFIMAATHLQVPRTTLGGLAGLLRQGAGRLVVDKTGLDGQYAVDLSYAPPQSGSSAAAAPNPGDAPDFFTAVQEQLGLKLVPSTSQVEVLVIDRIERPEEN
jgi:uncharacterized protein (TIGR03435 family)